MATQKYDHYREATLLGTAPNLATGVVKIMATCDALYTFNAAHNFLDDVSAARYPGTTDQTLTGKTTTAGRFDSADVTLPAVAISGVNVIDQLILYVDTGSPATSMLIARYDQFSPVTPNGNNILVAPAATGWIQN